MVFLTCGLGGGTGTGVTPVLAEIAKKEDCIVIGTVTMPFEIEGARMTKSRGRTLQTETTRRYCNRN